MTRLASTGTETAGARSPLLAPEWQLISFLWFCYVLNHADRQVVYTLFPALQKTFGYSNAVLGLTGALFLWVYGIFSPVAGILGDRLPTPGLVRGSLMVWSLLTIFSGLSPNGGFLLACRALLGIAESFFMPAAYALMAAAHGPQTRSRAIAVFGTSQIFGVATGGSLSAFIAERLSWRVSFWLLGGIGILFSIPLARFFQRMPSRFSAQAATRSPTGGRKLFRTAARRASPLCAGLEESQREAGAKANLASFLVLLRIPSVRLIALALAVATFGLFLVYTWLPTFLFDKFRLGLARAGFEASVYPQVGTGCGLLIGGWLADRYHARIKASRFWVIILALFCGAPCMFLLGSFGRLAEARMAAIAVGFFAGFIAGNQAPATFDVVPPALRASAIGVLNLVGALVSGFAPFLGGLARSTIGVDRVMLFTAVLYLATGIMLLYGVLRHFARDHRLSETI